MADDNKQVSKQAAPVVVPTPTSTEVLLAQAMAQIAGLMASQNELMKAQTEFNKFSKKNAPRRKKTMVDYLRENPRKRLLRPVFTNYRPVNPSGLAKETLATLDTLAPGTFCDGMITIVRIRDGANGINSRIHIFYDKSDEAKKMNFYMRFPSFTKIVTDVAAEMVAREIDPIVDAVPDPIEEEVPEFDE